MSRLNFDEGGAFAGADTLPKLTAAMERWNNEVQEVVPSARLLVWDPVEGLAPLCEFLEARRPGRGASAPERHQSLP